jgi:lipoprotein-anchoring transpeptidase ErfK/SrfK
VQSAAPATDIGTVGRARSAIVALVAVAWVGTLPAVSPHDAGAVTLRAQARTVGAAPALDTDAATAGAGPAEAPAPEGQAPETPVVEPAPPTDPRHLLVGMVRSVPITARPGAGPVVGTMPEGSRFYDRPIVAWVLEVSEDGRFGRVPVPYASRAATGWIRLRGLELRSTRVEVVADLSERRIEVLRAGDVVLRAPAAVGARRSPTPVGRYFVTDRVAFPGGGVLGTFAFGISGIQTRLPAGWTGGDQLAIHGTNAPATIGTASSAGCLRVSERVLDRLRPLLRLGTPVRVVA